MPPNHKSEHMPLAARPHVLVVDDDDRLRELLRKWLSGQGCVVTTASRVSEAREVLAVLQYDIVILDVMMPQETGLDLARELRSSHNPALRRLPIILLTAQGEPDERIAGLESGADDYIAKPFEPRELLLRIHAVLRRTPSPTSDESQTLRMGQWTYDPRRDELQSGDDIIRLTGMEAGLMRVLAADPGVTVSREVLAERSADGIVNDRTIDVQVTRLRRKIGDDPRNPRYLVTVRGEGYMLLPDE